MRHQRRSDEIDNIAQPLSGRGKLRIDLRELTRAVARRRLCRLAKAVEVYGHSTENRSAEAVRDFTRSFAVVTTEVSRRSQP
jgi:hypothetical protein